MKSSILTLFLLVFCIYVNGQDTITANQAFKYINKRVVLLDTVNYSKFINDKKRVLYMGKPSIKMRIIQIYKPGGIPKKGQLKDHLVLVVGDVKLIKKIPTIVLEGQFELVGPIDL